MHETKILLQSLPCESITTTTYLKMSVNEDETNVDNQRHPLFKMYPNQTGFIREDALERCKAYLEQHLIGKNCMAPRSCNRPRKCQCLLILEDEEITSVANYMVYFKGLKNDTQKAMMAEWIRASSIFKGQHKKRCFILPTIADDNAEPIPPRMVCINAVCAILNVGKNKLLASKKSMVFSHGLKGKTGAQSNKGKSSQDWRDSLKDYFEQLKNESVPFATRIVREQTGLTSRDDDPDLVALPPHMSKRRCYARWVHERGWEIKIINHANAYFAPVSEYKKRKHDDDEPIPLWPTGSESKQICQWSTFLNYWKQNYPNIKVCVTSNE